MRGLGKTIGDDRGEGERSTAHDKNHHAMTNIKYRHYNSEDDQQRQSNNTLTFYIQCNITPTSYTFIRVEAANEPTRCQQYTAVDE